MVRLEMCRVEINPRKLPSAALVGMYVWGAVSVPLKAVTVTGPETKAPLTSLRKKLPPIALKLPLVDVKIKLRPGEDVCRTLFAR
jgi:hypothetical protein